MKSSSKGFTLVELIVAVVIASILARIGFVTYTSYILRANRAVARATLVNLAAKQEVQLMQNGSYAATFQNLNGISGTSFSINQNGHIPCFVFDNPYCHLPAVCFYGAKLRLAASRYCLHGFHPEFQRTQAGAKFRRSGFRSHHLLGKIRRHSQ